MLGTHKVYMHTLRDTHHTRNVVEHWGDLDPKSQA